MKDILIYKANDRLGGFLMFIYAVHGSTVKFFGIVFAAVLTLALLLAFVPSKDQSAVPVLQNGPEEASSVIPSPTAITPASSGTVEAARNVSFEKIKTNEDRIALLARFGWEVEATPVEEAKVTIPAEFDRVMENYNEIQRAQGFDLSKYRNREMMRYTYRITNYPDYSGTVYCNLLIYKNRVVAADICSSDVNGFIAGLTGRAGTQR